MQLRRRGGMSLIEIVMAASVAAIVLLAIGGFITSAFSSSNKAKERAFAQTKAAQILEEVLSYRPTSASDNIDKFDTEGLQHRLTIRNVTADDAVSGNPARETGSYRYVRQVDVVPDPVDATVRSVTVKIWYAKRGSTPGIETGAVPLAVATGTVRSSKPINGSVQVIDVYALSIENIPHLYRDDSNNDNQILPSATDARKAFEASLGRIESANPWLKFHVTYIERLSVGRDNTYRPYMNDNKPLSGGTRDPLNAVYFYPGWLGTVGGEKVKYYDPDLIKGNLVVDRGGTLTNQGTAYPMADQFNHPVRYAEEFSSSSAHAPYGTPSQPPGTSGLSLRQFLEDLLSDTTGKYRNAMLVNLHGEVFPALALRNYADPAKAPDDSGPTSRQRRLVTHPYKLSFDTNERVTLLTHAYMDDGKFQPSVGGNDHNVYTSWGMDDENSKALIVIKDIRDYLGDNPDTGWPSIEDEERDSVTLDVIQRERTESGNDKTRYVRKRSWPGSLLTDAFGESPPIILGIGGRTNHSGPHVTEHNEGDHDRTGSHSLNHDPEWGNHSAHFPASWGYSDKDLVIPVRDLDYDARATADGGTKYGIRDGTATDTYDPEHLLFNRAYFPDPYLPFLSEPTDYKNPRNTARIITKFRLKSNAVGRRFEVETRLYDASTGGPTTRPEGISRTWFYYGMPWDAGKRLYWDSTNDRPAIPWTDQVQLVGDPRHNPYLDQRKNNTVNHYFSNFDTGKSMYCKDFLTNDGSAGKSLDTRNELIGQHYSSDGPPGVAGSAWDIKVAGSLDSWNGLKYDAPAYFRMWREALMRNNMVFVNPSGEPIGFLAMGGEFKLDKDVGGLTGMSIAGKPYIIGANAGQETDELITPSGNSGVQVVVRSNTSDQRIWAGVPWLGELYPSDFHTAPSGTWKWATRGNLPSGRYVDDVFYRETRQYLDTTTWSYGTDHGNGSAHVDNDSGLPSFTNGSTTSGGSALDADGIDGTATLTSTGATGAASLRMSLPATAGARYSFKLSGGMSTPEWTVGTYSANRVGLDWLLPGSVSPRWYYGHDNSTNVASAPFIMKDSFTGPIGKLAVVVPSTLRPTSKAQVANVFDVANTSATQAWFDATRVALGAANVKALPRVRITVPAVGAKLARAVQPLEWYGKWTRADGRPLSAQFANGETYPFDPSVGEPLDVVYFVKYRAASNLTWRLAKLNAPAASAAMNLAAGLPSYNTTVTPIGSAANPDGSSPYATKNTASWDASGLPAGAYVLRVEAFRTTDKTDRNQTIAGAYAYQEVDIVLN